MELVSTAINAAVVAAVGVILGWLAKNRLDAQDRRIDRLEERLEHRFDVVQRRIDGVQASIDGMRSDLTQVALAVGVRPSAGTQGS